MANRSKDLNLILNVELVKFSKIERKREKKNMRSHFKKYKSSLFKLWSMHQQDHHHLSH